MSRTRHSPQLIIRQQVPPIGATSPLPSTSLLEPAELAHLYRAWRFGRCRNPSGIVLTGKAEQ